MIHCEKNIEICARVTMRNHQRDTCVGRVGEAGPEENTCSEVRRRQGRSSLGGDKPGGNTGQRRGATSMDPGNTGGSGNRVARIAGRPGSSGYVTTSGRHHNKPNWLLFHVCKSRWQHERIKAFKSRSKYKKEGTIRIRKEMKDKTTRDVSKIGTI